MSDETTRPQERSWASETGWPGAAPPPSWAELEGLAGTSDEQELDAWLDAQDEGWPQPVVEEPVPPSEPEAPAAPPLPASLVPPQAEPEGPPPAVADEEPPTAEEPDTPEPLTTEPLAQPAVPPRRSATALLAVLSAVVLVLAGVTAYLAERSVSTRGGGGVEDARHDALQAARNAARLVFSYDYRHLDKDFAAGKAVTTGSFAEQYGTTTPKLVEVAKTYKAVVAADVSDAAVINATTSKVVVLVFVNQQSTSTLAAAPKITQSRVTMTLVHRDGRWLVSDVHAF
jgi:Mce-associated membrane protein